MISFSFSPENTFEAYVGIILIAVFLSIPYLTYKFGRYMEREEELSKRDDEWDAKHLNPKV